MKSLIKKVGSEVAYRTGLFKLGKFNVRILTFHLVNPKYFEKQIIHLVKYYKIIKLNETFSKNKNAVVLTFDDGYKNNLLYAYPVLKKYNLPATLFITYDFIDKNPFAWWDRLEFSGNSDVIAHLKSFLPDEVEKKVSNLTKLKNNSKKPEKYNFMNWAEIKKIMDIFDIGSHTLTHPILTKVPLGLAEREISESKKRIEEKIGVEISSFAYPNGNHSKSLSRLVEKAGYKYALIYDKGRINNETSPFQLYRRGINMNDNTQIFAAKVAGIF